MQLQYAVLLGVVAVLGAGYAWQVDRIKILTFQRVMLTVFIGLTLCSISELEFASAVFYTAVATGQGILIYRDRPRPLWWKGQHERIETKETDV